MPTPWRYREAARIMRAGGILAYPTEAVWGLGCDPANERAIARIIALKRRDPSAGFILVAAGLVDLETYVSDDGLRMLQRVAAAHARPTTWIVPARAPGRGLLTGRRNTIAVRLSTFPVVRELCRHFGGALTSTSANRSGVRPARTALAVRQAFPCGRGAVDFVLGGQVGGARDVSDIRFAVDGRLLRGGTRDGANAG